MKDEPPYEPLGARQLESLRVFHEVASALTSSLEIDTLLRAIMKQMEDFFGPEKWSLLLLDQDHARDGLRSLFRHRRVLC